MYGEPCQYCQLAFAYLHMGFSEVLWLVN